MPVSRVSVTMRIAARPDKPPAQEKRHRPESDAMRLFRSRM